MRKSLSALFVFLIIAVVSYAQDERIIPSYDENSGYIRDYPGVDIDVEPYMCSWKDSPVIIGHGGFAEQSVFTPGDPLKPPKKGALLKYIKAYNHGFLYGNLKTTSVRHDNEQVVFYIMRGSGTVSAGGKTSKINEGTGIFIPAGLEYSFANTSGSVMEAVIIVESIPSGFKPVKDMVVKSYYDQTAGFCCWAYTTYGLFSKADGLAEPMGIAIVTVDGYGMGSPHFHVEGCEEVWFKIKGDENPALLGKELLRMNIGDGFLPPPNGLVPHAVINPTEGQIAFLYMGNRHDKK